MTYGEWATTYLLFFVLGGIFWTHAPLVSALIWLCGPIWFRRSLRRP